MEMLGSGVLPRNSRFGCTRGSMIDWNVEPKATGVCREGGLHLSAGGYNVIPVIRAYVSPFPAGPLLSLVPYHHLSTMRLLACISSRMFSFSPISPSMTR